MKRNRHSLQHSIMWRVPMRKTWHTGTFFFSYHLSISSERSTSNTIGDIEVASQNAEYQRGETQTYPRPHSPDSVTFHNHWSILWLSLFFLNQDLKDTKDIMVKETITGSCNCGAISIEFPKSAYPENCVKCHCQGCRASSGGLYVPLYLSDFLSRDFRRTLSSLQKRRSIRSMM